jgi:hypothetical protein
MSANQNIEAFDSRVRLSVYRHFIRTGRAPSQEETARAVSHPARDSRAALRRLAAHHALVLQDGADEVLRAAPFWAVPTRFHVEVGKRFYWGSCIWDALGIPVMLGKNARILAACGCCDHNLTLEVRNGALAKVRGVVHFAVPARHWYDNIVFT